MTPAEQIARAVLESYSGPYYVAGTDTQRERVLAVATQAVALILAPTIYEAIRAAAQNPT